MKGATAVKDPVCGMGIETATAAGRTEYKRQTYYFCGSRCNDKFALLVAIPGQVFRNAEERWWLLQLNPTMPSARAWERLSMIDPVNHAWNAGAIAIYKVGPFVVASDVYALSPHTGRGGWTWYSGAAGWMCRLIVESFLGLRLEADKPHVEPCIPHTGRPSR